MKEFPSCLQTNSYYFAICTKLCPLFSIPTVSTTKEHPSCTINAKRQPFCIIYAVRVTCVQQNQCTKCILQIEVCLAIYVGGLTHVILNWILLLLKFWSEIRSITHIKYLHRNCKRALTFHNEKRPLDHLFICFFFFFFLLLKKYIYFETWAGSISSHRCKMGTTYSWDLQFRK